MMTKIILYPTETLYALGVNALDPEALAALYDLKGRDSTKVASWLVRDVADIATYAELGEVGAKIAQRFLPGKLTLVLPTKPHVSRAVTAPDDTIGFRVSADRVAQKLIADFMSEHDAPLTCTSANVSGSPTYSTTSEILQQFGATANQITQILDDGPRKGLASTVVKVVGNELTVIREGEISEAELRAIL